MIYDDSDCVESCNLIKLVYDHNMKFADAFDHEVEHVSLFLFDADSRHLVARTDVKATELTDNNELFLNITPGSYDVIVWAGSPDRHFQIADGKVSTSVTEDFHCRMNRLEAGHVKEDVGRLYHGQMHLEARYASPSDPQRSTLYLKKNTNTVRVVLQHITGDRVNCDDFEFAITDNNGWLNHDNTLRDDEMLTYHPWHLVSGSVDINTNPTDAPGTKAEDAPFISTRAELGAALAEFTVNRLIWQKNPHLKITDKAKNRTVMDINLNDYAMLVKGFYNQKMDEQEYLDRQDEYNMTFFLDEGNRWINTVVIINDWRIVRIPTDLN